MTKHLIVTADDFGLSKSINEGIAKAHKEGIVTFLNVMPTGAALDDALNLLGDIKPKEIGAHLSLTETRPLTDPHKIPNLVIKDGWFHPHKTGLFRDLFIKKINKEEIYTELKSQLDRICAAGLRVTSLSSHEHIHMMPVILDIFIRLAKEYQIEAIRYPHNETLISPLNINKIYKKLILSCFERYMGNVLRREKIAYTDNFIGFLDSGALTEDIIIKILGFLRQGATELVCHPGFLGPEILDRYRFHMNCETELYGLTSRRVKDLVNSLGINLITYGDFLSKR